MNKVRSKAFSYLGLNRGTMILFAAMTVVGSGEHMWLKFIPKYLEVLGASIFVIGLADFIETILAAVYGYPGGVVTDKYGVRRCLIFFTGLSIAGYLILLIFPGWQAVIIGMFFYLGWSNLSQPAFFAFISKALPVSKHVMGMSLVSIVNRIPRIGGPLLGGLLIGALGFAEGVRIALIISIFCGLIGIVLMFRIPFDQPVGKPRFDIRKLWRSLDRNWKMLLLADIFARFCQRLPFAFVILYAINNLGVSAGKFGLLLTLEVVVSISIYIPVAHFADRLTRKPFVMGTFIFFALFPMMLLLANSFWMLLIAFIVRGLKEFGEPSRKSLLISLAPPEKVGSSIGCYYLVRDLIASTGSFIGAWLWHVGPGYNFITAALFGLLSAIIFAIAFREPVKLRSDSGSES